MHANLVCSAGFQAAAYIACSGKTFQHTKVRDGMLTAGETALHFLSIFRISPQRSIHRSLVFSDNPLGKREILSGDAVLFELCRNALMRPVILTCNDDTGRVLVNAMYNAGTQNAVNTGQAVLTVI